MPVGKKIACGFAAITVLAAIVGVIGFVSARQITAAGETAAAAGIVDVEMLRCRQEEKNFVIRKWAKAGNDTQNSEEKLRENITLLAHGIDELEAKLTNDAHLREIQQGRTALKQYEQACNRFIDSQRHMDTALEKARDTARQVQTAALDKVRTPAKALMIAGTNAVGANMELADTANRIIRFIVQCRRDEKQYVIDGQDASYKHWQDSTAQLKGNTGLAQLAAAEDPAIQALIAKACPVIKQYVAAGSALADANLADAAARAKDKNLETMRTTAREIETLASDTRAHLKKVMEARVADNVRLLDVTGTANRIVRLCVECRQHEKQYVIDQANWDNWEKTVAQAEGDQGVAHLEQTVKDAKLKAGIKETAAAFKAYQEACQTYKANRAEQVEAEGQLVATAREVAALANTLNEAALDEMASQSATAMTIIIGTLGACVLIAVVLAFFISRGITGTLKRIVENLSSGAQQTTSASGQVSESSQQLAEGASEQAASLEETSSSLEEITAMVNQNADNAQQANQLAEETRSAGDTGTGSMDKLNKAMVSISASSNEMGKIIKSIEEIAFQTNLLALNAAVEAARAGEHGKGFAVVAEEVRNLAQRSAQAAQETNERIQESIKEIGTGTKLAEETGSALGNIVSATQKTADLVGEIAAASKEQADGIKQVNAAVAQMDKVTQQNAATAEESAAASEELNAQAASMQEIVGELNQLVGGTAQNNTASRGGASPRAAARSTTVREPSAMATTARSKPSRNAAQTIPLDDDEADGQFEDFSS